METRGAGDLTVDISLGQGGSRSEGGGCVQRGLHSTENHGLGIRAPAPSCTGTASKAVRVLATAKTCNYRSAASPPRQGNIGRYKTSPGSGFSTCEAIHPCLRDVQKNEARISRVHICGRLTKWMWSLLGPTPLPSLISMVIDRDTTSREAKSFADGAYLCISQIGGKESLVVVALVLLPLTVGNAL